MTTRSIESDPRVDPLPCTILVALPALIRYRAQFELRADVYGLSQCVLDRVYVEPVIASLTHAHHELKIQSVSYD